MSPTVADYIVIVSMFVLYLAACASLVRTAVPSWRAQVSGRMAFLLIACFAIALVSCLVCKSLLLAHDWLVAGAAIASVAATTLACLGMNHIWRAADNERSRAEQQIKRLTDDYALLETSHSKLDAAQSSIEVMCARCARQYSLTRKEEEILAHIAHGSTYPKIAAALFVSPNTVKTHARNIYRKLGVSSRQEIANLVSDANPSNQKTNSS